MRRSAALVVLLAVGACASPSPSPSAAGPSTTPAPPTVDCGPLAESLCGSVADAAQLMTGTAPLMVMAFPASTADGTPIEERYVVTLQPEDGEAETQLVEVVRFEGSENWSVRRLESMPTD